MDAQEQPGQMGEPFDDGFDGEAFEVDDQGEFNEYDEPFEDEYDHEMPEDEDNRDMDAVNDVDRVDAISNENGIADQESENGFTEDGMQTPTSEDDHPSADEIRQWNAQQTAEYLRRRGVADSHCDTFEEQGITGSVLLDMDQDAILSHRMDLGVMGQRLQTCSQIAQIQREANITLLTPPESPRTPSPATDTHILDAKEQQEPPHKAFKHPFKWRDNMVTKLRVREENFIPETDLLDDLSPKWASKNSEFSTSIANSRAIQLHGLADFRSKINQADPVGVERATALMCADWLDHFNSSRKLKLYRSRFVQVLNPYVFY